MTTTRDAMPNAWKLTTLVIVFAIVGMAVVLFAATGSGSASQPPPGLTAGVSALDDLPAESSIPENVMSTLRVLSPAVVGPIDRTAKQMRKLRANLGASETEIYAFRSTTRSVCFIARAHAAICPSSLQAGRAGFLFAIGGGHGTAESPGILAGIAADNVTGIDLTVDGTTVPVTIANNAAFAELPTPARRAEIVVHYSGFDDQEFAVDLD